MSRENPGEICTDYEINICRDYGGCGTLGDSAVNGVRDLMFLGLILEENCVELPSVIIMSGTFLWDS